MLVGNVFSIGTGGLFGYSFESNAALFLFIIRFSQGLLVVVFTLATTKPLNVDQIGEVWEKTRDIDSPLMPWTEIYAKLDLEFFLFKI